MTVVANALNIASELAVWPHIKLVVLGGVSRPQSYELIGSLSIPVLRTLTIDLMFLGVDAIDPVDGAACAHEEEAVINRGMVERSHGVVAVADAPSWPARVLHDLRHRRRTHAGDRHRRRARRDRAVRSSRRTNAAGLTLRPRHGVDELAKTVQVDVNVRGVCAT